MMRLNFDVKKMGADIAAKLAAINNPEALLRPIAFDLVAKMTERIHDRGLASDGGPIGTYSDPYLRTRQAKYKRGADTKVIVSATRQLENDWSVVATGKKSYGIGFKNQHNRDKSKWVEATYNKKIFSLTADERQYAQNRFKELVSEQFNP